MSETEDSDDPISKLNNLRKRLEGTIHPTDENEELPEIKDDTDSSAIEEYLSSRLQQIGEVTPETKEHKGLRTGNGWDSEKIIEQGYKIEPIPIKRAVDIAISSNRGLRERIAGKLRSEKQVTRLIGEPTVEFVPIWKMKGFHECYYLRTNSYRVSVKADVVGVEVEGKSRDLILERRHRRFIPTAIVERLLRLGGFLSSESKYFVIGGVTELAKIRSESELVIAWNGKNLEADDELILTSWRPKKVFDESDLTVRGAKVRIREPNISKEDLLATFRTQVIRMPERFKQILSSRLQITDFRRIYIPLIRVTLQKGLVPNEIIINGSSGQIADREILRMLS
ncbi:MAG TPA: hypothetical protein VEH56_07590 [Candidatus Saccharimonadales bacterium]|nr:hypothetical protein [Candidatus Saccharimonadales bacterium]